MEKDRVEIKLNSPDNIYFTGQLIKGEIIFFLTKKTKIRAIHLQVVGKGKCKWVEIFHRDNYGNFNTRNVFYSGKDVLLNDTINCPYVPARGLELSPGELPIGFTYLLSEYLPSSFKGNYGSIKYKLNVIIQKPWAFDEKYTIPLTIIQYILSPPITAINPPQPQVFQLTRNVSVFASGPISLVAKLPSNFVVRNEKVTLVVIVDNQSSIHVDKLRFTIVQKTMYCSQKPIVNFKSESVVIFTKETGGVEKKSERSFAHEILVPACPPTATTMLFRISYSFNVEAILPAFYKNLSLSLPIQVYSADGNRAPGNPFEGGDESIDNTVFPVDNRLSVSQTADSPSRSQLQTESESSSLYSTTSESSTATLSPAPGVNDSAVINRGSTRNSFRNSLGYPCSTLPRHPLATQLEHPAAAHSQMPPEIYAPPEMDSSYPPPSISSLSFCQQSSVHFEVQARYPIHELPPSYEELFGSSTTPTAPSPETPV